ncbi:PIR Superfamily Protein [Plasmodium ovale wallikeri]|uniref:PIR Superfamily Protein n=2 Tax=Plasmodium ovale TaxID=36330 RepID=A0A1A8YP07_PLAOA|nr:PIR Superfamily Protein [Plasmodium ovale wallikeri]SBT58899.1 PIR Superfamily Protein [Plasmodium ovale wallikeri]SBT73354.1 hypothetical protein POWCR01_000105400 [Plasmodium ovale]
MAEISTDDLPSKNLYKKLEESIEYSNISEYIINEGFETETYEWSNNLKTKLDNFLDLHALNVSQIKADKRCRDVIHILNDLTQKIRNLGDNYSSYQYTEQNIGSIIQTSLPPYGFQNCPKILPTEIEDVNYDKKVVDDFIEDITYINDNINQINCNPHCAEIRQHMKEKHIMFKGILNQNDEKYSNILTFYGKSRNDKFDDMMAEITCNSSKQDGDVTIQGKSGESGVSSGYISISLVFSLLGILITSVFAYNFTPFGPWLNTTLRKKNIFLKKYNAEENHEMLEDIPGITHTSVRNKGYNMLYHSLEE